MSVYIGILNSWNKIDNIFQFLPAFGSYDQNT